MAAKVAGRNGLVYVSGGELTYANAWELTCDQEAVGGAHFGQGWMDNDAGMKTWGGTLTAWHDQDSQKLYSAATAGTTVALMIYPNRSDLTTYWSGNAIFTGFRSGGEMGGLVTQSCDYAGAGSLTATGFS